ncbi:MAG TPA: hypothetical protein VEH50_12060 [Methylomirabilota bacterium]|nr:hypothetical protein [Methylomirabilota bacterium]
MKRLSLIAKWTFAGTLSAAALLYGGDYLVVRFKMSQPKFGNAFGSVRLQPIYAVAQKNGKSELYLGNPETDTCVHSIFPHFGYAPCWYLNRKKNEMIPMMILPRWDLAPLQRARTGDSGRVDDEGAASA